MDAFTIKQAAQAVGGTIWRSTNKMMTNIVIDNREATDGCLYVAIKGERFDGHDFVDSAVKNGAVAAVCERLVSGCPVIQVEDTRRALLDLARFNRRRFSGMVVGVTGSVGKTTTKEMVAAVLSYDRSVLKTDGNLNNAIGLSKTLFRLNSNYQAAVIEMGMSALGEISALSQTTQPTVGIITNIGVSHLETLGSRENIKKAKLEIMDGMAPDAPLIVGGDNEYLRDLFVAGRKVIFCGIDNKNADYRAENIQSDGMCTTFDVVHRSGNISVRLPVLGKHNVLNALFGFAVGQLAGMSFEEIAKALASYQPAGMRQKTVVRNGVTLIADCYNASPESMQAALCILQQQPTAGRRIAVLGDMLELGSLSKQAHKEVGEAAAQLGADIVYCIGQYAGDICEGASIGKCIVRHFENKDVLTDELSRTLKAGDSVMFKASRAVHLESVIRDLFGEI